MGRVKSLQANPDGGVPKPQVGSIMVAHRGVIGDRQRDLKHHGGPDRAVCLYSAELIDELRKEGHPIFAGSTGENVTVEGVSWEDLRPGSRLAVGPVILEITSYAAPCSTIEGSFKDGKFVRIGHKQNPGWSRLYARVVKEGTITVGDEVRPFKAKPGAIAVCGIGTVGVITSEGPVPVKYLDGNEGIAWTGIHLGYGEDGLTRKVSVKPGDLWSSQRPRIIAESIHDLLNKDAQDPRT